jgi:hypothetical protein
MTVTVPFGVYLTGNLRQMIRDPFVLGVDMELLAKLLRRHILHARWTEMPGGTPLAV